MKLYTDITGKFQMYIPLNWEYKNPSLYKEIESGRPQAFGTYGKLLGAFQISCKKVTEHISNLIKTRKEIIQSSNSEQLLFSEMLLAEENLENYMFSCAVDDHYFFATYILTDKKKELRKKYEEELQDVRTALKSIKFIKPEFRQIVSSKRRFNLFMTSIAATVDLMNKAHQNESLIEYVALSANRIDALLRLSIILTKQIEGRSDEIDTKYLFQAETDKAIMERKIYKIVLEKGIINQTIFEDLEELYKERNKVIHRYIITDIRTEDIGRIAYDYQQLSDKIEVIINQIEEKQYKMKLGIHKDNDKLAMLDDFRFKELISNIRDKHGNLRVKEILGEKI